MHGGSLYGSLGGKEEQPFDMFNFLFGKNNGVLRDTECTSKHITDSSHVENTMFPVDQLTITVHRRVDQRTWSSTWFPLGTAPNT